MATTTSSSSFAPALVRRLAAVTSVLSVIAVAAAVLALAVGASLPEAWWPRTGAAFAAEASTASPSSPSSVRQDSCDLIAGPAKEYCERATTTSASISPPVAARGQGLADAVWPLAPVGAGLAALVIWRRSATARERA
ncbi:hypothetical protein [Streptomyces sp. NPDC046909]|uniref:hypothetical protein n=1 Tax=Streptomyces sp. NPDC046909 TaxID=3155617 RepID=UPI00340457ED